jgi:hypothetical protein
LWATRQRRSAALSITTAIEIDAVYIGPESSGKALCSITTGWHHAYYHGRHTICADRVNGGTFYIYNSLGAAQGGGVYKSTDQGDTWTRQFAGKLDGTSGANDKLRCVPNLAGSVSTAGHLFYSAGIAGSALKRSTDGGATWKAILNVGENYCFGFGAVKPGNDYPSIYFAGTLRGNYGIWQSDASSKQWDSADTIGLTWTQRGPYPLNSTDAAKWIEGDANTYGKFYMGTANSAMYYRP